MNLGNSRGSGWHLPKSWELTRFVRPKWKLDFEFLTCSFILAWDGNVKGSGMTLKKNNIFLVVLVAAVLSSTGCNVKRQALSFLPTRIAREFTSEQTNFHTITPIRGDLR